MQLLWDFETRGASEQHPYLSIYIFVLPHGWVRCSHSVLRLFHVQSHIDRPPELRVQVLLTDADLASMAAVASSWGGTLHIYVMLVVPKDHLQELHVVLC